MKKAYWIAHVTVTDPESYALYARAAPAAFEAHGARILARGGAFEEMEGATGRERHVVIEFPSMQAALDCYRSDAYQGAAKHRAEAGRAHVLIVEGV